MMNNKTDLLKRLERVERLASTTRMGRLAENPLKYISTMLFNHIIYPITKKEKPITSSAFFNKPMHLYLPASTDIHLTSGKSHYSEIRLAKFMILNISVGQCIFDIGAHYGYFTLLASILCQEEGQVYAFEAAPPSYEILRKNTNEIPNIIANNMAVSDQSRQLDFYVFPNKYSEYNSFNIDQFKSSSWYSKYLPTSYKVEGKILDEYIFEKKINPDFFKIDVEGAEINVIKGLKKYLTLNNPILIMEYLADERNNENHKQACSLLNSLNYKSYIILAQGDLKETPNIQDYFYSEKIDSDNIVFLKNYDSSSA